MELDAPKVDQQGATTTAEWYAMSPLQARANLCWKALVIRGVISQVSENGIMDWARVAKDHQGAAFLD